MHSTSFKETLLFLENLLSLSLLRGFSRVLPIFTTPFLMRTIGVEKFGTIEFIKAFCFYLIILTDYGFNYSATHQISINRDKKDRIDEIISSVLIIKILFSCISILLLFICIQFIPIFQNIKWPLLLYFPVVLCNTFFPLFVFQGIEKMKLMTAINLIAKGLFLITIVTWIKQPEDYLLYPIFLSIADLIRLIIGAYYMKKLTDFQFKLPSLKELYFQLKDGFAIFSSMISINFYSRLPALFLGFFCSHFAVGLYTSSVRIVRSTLGFIDPLTQALFPLATRKIHQNKATGIKYILKSLKYSSIVAFLIGLIYFIFAKPILIFISGKLLPTATQILRLHSFLPLIITISNVIGIQLLIPLEKRSSYSLTMFYTAILASLLLFILTPKFAALGAAWAIFISELFATILMFWFFYKSKLKNSALSLHS